MVVIGDKLVSLSIFEDYFVCDLDACKGACCIEGDSGAPLLAEEIDQITAALPATLPLLPPAQQAIIQEHGFYEIDSDGDLVTQCLSGRECVFATTNAKGHYSCSLEQLHTAGLSTFLKPQSCHLYPIRLSQVGEYTALSYDHWSICSPACRLGQHLRVPLYQFLAGPLTRAFGPAWYAELSAVATDYLSSKEGR